MIKVPSLAQDIDVMEGRLKTFRETVMQDATYSLETVSVEPDQSELEKVLSKQLMTELNHARFRVLRKEQLLHSLNLQSESLRYEQESLNTLETFSTNRSIERTRGVSFLEFDPTMLNERRENLDKEIEVMVGNLETEDFYTEQMSALLLRTHEAMLRSRAKTDQLRYLQRRLLKRHDEISTMHTRASNEFIHTAHQVQKTTEAFNKDSQKREQKLMDKSQELEFLRQEIERKSEVLAKHMLAEQESDLHSKRIQAELNRVTKIHGEARKLERANREIIRKAQEGLEKIRR